MREVTHYNYRIREIACGEVRGMLGAMFQIQEQECGNVTRRWFKTVSEPYIGDWSDDTHIRVPHHNGNWMSSTTVVSMYPNEKRANEILNMIVAARKQRIVKEIITE